MEYTFQEPPPGTERIPEQICVRVFEGSVGTPLIVTLLFEDGTAMGKGKILGAGLPNRIDSELEVKS